MRTLGITKPPHTALGAALRWRCCGQPGAGWPCQGDDTPEILHFTSATPAWPPLQGFRQPADGGCLGMACTCRLMSGKQGHFCCCRMTWPLKCLTFPVSCWVHMLSSLLPVFKIEKWNTLAEKWPFPFFLKVFFIFMERFSIAGPTSRMNGTYFAKVQTREPRAVGVLLCFLPSTEPFVLDVASARPELLPVCRKVPG